MPCFLCKLWEGSGPVNGIAREIHLSFGKFVNRSCSSGTTKALPSKVCQAPVPTSGIDSLLLFVHYVNHERDPHKTCT